MNQLPVPADQVLSNQFVQQQPPPLPVQLQLSQQEAVQLHCALINAIQRSANKTPLRAFLANMASSQGYHNPFYAELLQRASEYYMVLAQQGQADPERVAEETVITEFPSLAQNYPQLQSYLTPQQQQELHGLYNHRQQIKQMIEQMMGGGQPSGGMGGGFTPTGPAPGGMGNPQGGMGGPQGGMPGGGFSPMQGGGPGQPAMGGFGGGNTPMGGGRPAPASYGQMGQGNSAPGGYRPNQPMNPSAMLNNPGGGPQSSGMDNGRPSTAGAAGVKPNPNDRVEESKPEEPSMLDPTDRDLTHELTKTRPDYAPAVAQPSQSQQRYIYPPLHRHDQVVNTVEEDGIKYYIVEDKSMEYEDHETSPELIRLSRSMKVGPKVSHSPRWPDVSSPNPVSSVEPDRVNEEVEEGDEAPEPMYKRLSDDDPVMLQEPVSAYSIHQAHAKAAQQLHEGHVDSLSGRVYEYMAYIRTPIVVNQQQYQALGELIGDSPELVELKDRLQRMSDEIPSYIWYLIHDRLTARFNERLKAGAGLDAEVDSIIEDYNDALQFVDSKLSREAYDRFRSNARIYLLKSVGVQRDSVAKESFLHESYYFVHLPWTSEEIDLKIGYQYGLITQAAHEDLQVAARRLFERTNTPSRSPNRRYLVTADNVYLELHAADLGDASSLMITRRQFD